MMKICLALVFCVPLLADASSYFYQPQAFSAYYSPRTFYSRTYGNSYSINKPFTVFNSSVQSPSLRNAPAPTSCTSAFCQRFGFNLDEKVRFEWDRQQPKILALAQNPKTAGLVQEMVDANPCVDTLDAYDALIEVGVRYLEVNARELEDSYMTVLSLR